MRRWLLLTLALSVSIAALAAYSAVSRDREYDRLIEAGDRALCAGDPSRAVEAFSGAIALRPASMLAHLRRGEVYRDLGRRDSALRDLQTAVQLDPTSLRALEQLSDVYRELGWHAEAERGYAQYVGLVAGSPRAFYKLALAQYHQGRIVSAIDALGKALAFDQPFPEGHYLLGLCYLEQGRTTDAERALQRAIDLAPTMVVARQELARLLRGQGRFTQELAELSTLVRLEPNRAERFAALGLAYARVGRLEQALETFARGDLVDAEHPSILLARGRVWLERADRQRDRAALAQAVDALQHAVADHPSSEALTLLGRALLLAGERPLARQILERATRLFPVDPDALSALADAARLDDLTAVEQSLLVRADTLLADTDGLSAGRRRLIRLVTTSLELQDPWSAAAWLEAALRRGYAMPVEPAIQTADALSKAGARTRALDLLRAMRAAQPGQTLLARAVRGLEATAPADAASTR